MKSLLIALLCHLAALCAAQNSPPVRLRFNHLFVKDGLIEGRVHPIIQDKEGYMWMGTHNGLVRYNGYGLKTYLLTGKKLNRTRISDIYVDAKGELWVGTYSNGLYKYDRADDTFMLCTPDAVSEPHIQAGNIDNIISDKLGNIWFVMHDRLTGTESVFSFDVQQHRFTHYSNAATGNQYTNYTNYFSPIITDNKGNIWCGSDNGLKEYDYQHHRFIEHSSTSNPALQKNFSMLCIDKTNPHILWAAIWNDQWDKFESIGKYNMDTDSLTIYQHPQPDTSNPADDYIYHIICDAKSNIWVITQHAIIHYDVAGNRFTNFTPPAASLGLKPIYDFEEDRNGNFWLLVNWGGVEGELAYFNTTTKQFTQYASNTNKAEEIRSPHDLYLDPAGALWFGVGNKGVQWIDKESSKITFHTSPAGRQRSGQPLFADGAEAPDHTVWFATDAGLCHWYPAKDSFEWITLGAAGQPPLLITTIMIDKAGRIWCGNNTPNLRGLLCYNPASKSVKAYTFNQQDTNTISSNRVAALLEDPSGDIWVGTYEGGLCRLNSKTGKFTRYPHISNLERTPNDHQLDDHDVQCLYQDKEGTLWVGTIWGSLNKLDKASKTFTSFENKVPQLKGVLTIFEDSRHNLWVGTYTNGLFFINKKSGTTKLISERDGLLYNEIEGILEDNQGNLWLNSVKGISIYNPQTKAVRNMTNELLEDEMPNRLCYKLSSGAFIFSSKEGFVTLYPNNFAPDSTTPVVHIETVVFNKPQSEDAMVDSTILLYGKKEIRLHYDENRITFSYAGLLYQNTAQIRYWYKLEGYDKYWVNARTQRTVTYTNLSPGTYTFRVMAANSDGVWSRQADAITIVITPPFWATWWFRIVLVTAITGVAVLIVKVYLNRRLRAQQQAFERQQAIDKVRSKISMDIHDEISSGLTKISLLSQRVKTKYEKSKEVEGEIIDKIAGSSREVINNLGEIIWAVNPTHDNLSSLLAYIRNYVFTFFESTPIEPRIHFPEEVPAVTISPDVKHNLFLVIKENLNNIVKHAAATEVSIHFHCTDENYTFTIADNGIGMEQVNGRTFGNGFINMRKRMEAIAGSIVIHSAKNKGTGVQLKGRFRVE